MSSYYILLLYANGNPNGMISGCASGHYCANHNATVYDSGLPIRPIVTLKNGLSYVGGGTKTFPMEIQ